MPSGDSSLSSRGQSAADILVIGGGIMGLWGAVKAAQSGLSVILIDRGRIGGGASGGLMGAMFPWMPDRWDAKKQFQYEALVSLPAEIAGLERATGLDAGFRRCGRIIPLPKPHLKTIALRHQADALANWHQGDNRFFWQVSDLPPVADYIATEFAAGGYVHDTLAARIAPRAVAALLKAWLELQPNVQVFQNAALVELDAVTGRAEIVAAPSSDPSGHLLPVGEKRQTASPARLQSHRLMVWDGSAATSLFSPAGRRWPEGSDEGALRTQTLAFSHAFIAAGVDSFPILETLLPPLPAPLGQGVKGQAAMLRAGFDPSLPVAFLDGLYVVPHENGDVAVGSTSENRYGDPLSTDEQLDTVLEKARALVPALRDAPVSERWAGIRPKAIGRDPLIGPVQGHPNVISLTGGFKISFGMAHRLADAAVDYALDRQPPGLPENFTLAGQIGREFGVSL